MIGSYEIYVNGTNVTPVVLPYADQIVYRDNMGLISDTLDITMIDSKLTSEEIFPDGAEVQAEFTTDDGKTLKTGKLFVDTESGRISPGSNEYTMGANSQPDRRPCMKKFVAYKRKRVTLDVLLKEILSKIDFTLIYRFLKEDGSPWVVNLRNIAIQNERMGAVLSQYADTFGCFLKIYDDRLIIANKASFSDDPVLKTVVPSVESIRNFTYDINEHQFGEYAVSYYNPRTGKVTTDKKNKKSILITESETVKNIIQSVADAGAAQALAMAVDGQRQATIRFTTEGTEKAIAGGVWEIKEINKLSGKYVITNATHTISENWEVEVEAENIF